MAGVIVLLGGNIEAAPIAQRAVELGFYPIVVDIDARCAARDVPGVRFVQASCYHGEQVIAALKAAQIKPDGIMCSATDAPIACAEVAAAFGLHGLSVEAARLGQDKFNQAVTLSTGGIGIITPDFYLCDEESFVSKAPWPLSIIKPLDSRGGRGVIRLLPGVDPAFAYEIAKANSPTGRVMVEEWLDGPQLSTESLVQNGQVLFTAVGLRNYDRLDEYKPFCIEDGFEEPWDGRDFANEINSYNQVIKNTVIAACRALGWYQQGAGTVKGDLVIHAGRVYVIELACRLSGGFFATHGHEAAYGVDFVGSAIKAALGYTLEVPAPYARNFVAQRYLFPCVSDIGKTVKEYYTGTLGKGDFTTYNIHVGQIIEPVTSHPQRLGQAIATGRTPDEARQRAEAAVAAMYAAVVLE